MRSLPCRGSWNASNFRPVRASTTAIATVSSSLSPCCRHPNGLVIIAESRQHKFELAKPDSTLRRSYVTIISTGYRAQKESARRHHVELEIAPTRRTRMIYDTPGPSSLTRRSASSKAPASSGDERHVGESLNPTTANGHEHSHSREHIHEHNHGVFGLGGHDHNHEHQRADPEKFIETLKGGGDRGSRITLIGLFANVGLTAAKGIAGWFLHSASLLADAGHSMSDLLGDFVTLFCWKLSRRPKSPRYPYGYGKYETIGTVSISLLLVGGSLGIGFHSYNLLLEALYPSIQTLPPGLAHDILQTIVQTTSSISSQVEGQTNEHSGVVLDPNAAWFAAVSVIAKEWLYRVTKKVADDEHSGVLMANAIHHRSDAWSSLVALVAILGTWSVPGLPLDPLGGLIVSFVILGQGMGLLRGAFSQLVDRGVSEKTRMTLVRQLNPLFDPSTPSLRLRHLTDIQDVRAVRSGALMFVDLIAILPPQTTMAEAYFVQEQINKRLLSFKKEISEVRVKMVPEPLPDTTEAEDQHHQS